MGNDPFIDGLPIKNGGSFHGYVSHNQMVGKILQTSELWCQDASGLMQKLDFHRFKGDSRVHPARHGR
jgi:hypothetical protein